MSQTKLYTQLIQSLEDPEFDKIAKKYLEDIDGITGIINCNGPYDSGLDFRVENVSNIEIQYQATTREKRFKSKLLEDLEKAAKNVSDFGLPKKVKYFYSYPLSTHTILEYKKQAKDNHGIILEMVEANTIAEISIVYDTIGTLLLELSDFDRFTKTSEFFDDVKVRAFYDLMSIGSATDIKYNIIKSFVLNYLFSNGSTNKNLIVQKVNEHFESSLEATYFEGVLRRLNSEGKIQEVDSFNINLTDIEKERLESVLENYNQEEALLKKQLSDVLQDYKLESRLDEIIVCLSELYESNFAINLGEFTKRDSTIADLETATNKFGSFLKSILKDGAQSDILATKLFAVADNNAILSRIASGRVYSKVSDPERLEDYVRQHHNNKDIYLDTNVLINMLCAHYEPDADYNNYHYKVARQFLNFAEENDLSFKTIRRYAIETTKLFKEALALVPFTKIPDFELFGGSKNVLLSFYLHLKDWDRLESNVESFEDFLKEFKFEVRATGLSYSYRSQIEYLLNSMNTEVVEIEDEYELQPTKDLIEKDLRDHRRYKTPSATASDALMFRFLGDPDVEINPIEPIFCTWDMTLMRVRKLYFEDHPDSTKWLMYTPTRLMDHFSMMNLKVREGTLSNEVLTILEEDFSFQEKTQRLLDSMLTIINPNDEVGLKYANKLLELKKQEVVQVDHEDENIPDESKIETSLDKVFNKLYINYAFDAQHGQFDAFKSIFTKEDLFDRVFAIITNEFDYVNTHGQVSSDLIPSIDELLKELEESDS